MDPTARRRFLASLLGAPAAAQTFQNAGQTIVGFRAETASPRSECGTGALMPWADALWVATYNSHMQGTGKGLALYRIDETLRAEKLHVHDGTHANRLVHRESGQCFIGPYVIDARGNWKFIPELNRHRLTATARHLTDPQGRVYFLTMEGVLLEMGVDDLKPRVLSDLVKEMKIAARPHFKGAYSAQGRLAVANNGFYEFGDNEAGLFEFDGKSWRKLSGKPHMDVAARENMGSVLFATGWDEASVLFWALVQGQWQRYRLPFASHAFAHAWQTEWMRIREVETERFLMDIQGMFYELQPIAFENRIWGVKPVCQHLRVIPDYCSFRGMFVCGGNQTTPNMDNYAAAGQPQSGLWFGKTDDLWSWGRPQGWGGPWRNTPVRKGEFSDPFLLTGFQRKALHLAADREASFAVQVDILGNGTWHGFETATLSGGAMKTVIFPDAFSAHWVRLESRQDCRATAQFFYT